MEGVRFAVLGSREEVTSACHEWTIPTYSTYLCLRIKQKTAYQGMLGHQMHNTPHHAKAPLWAGLSGSQPFGQSLRIAQQIVY